MKEEILQDHDFIYERPPVEWETCVPLANGFIGAALWGDGNPLKISLDKCDVWEKRFPKMDEKTYRYA